MLKWNQEFAGRVMGSRGSVIALFQKQIQEGGPIAVTHADVVRFFTQGERLTEELLARGKPLSHAV